MTSGYRIAPSLRRQLTEAAHQFGTPLYWYDLDAIAEKAANLVAALPARVAIRYALKANSSLAVCEAVCDSGLGADVCSEGELTTALAARFSPETMVFTGPAKTDAELRLAIESGVRFIAAESLGECRQIDRLAHGLGRRQAVLLRVHDRLDDPIEERGSALHFESEKFGFSSAGVIEQLPDLAGLEHLDLHGLLFHHGSCVCDAEELLALYGRYISVARVLARTGIPVKTIDLGGGLGVPYGGAESELDLVALGSGLARLISDCPDWEFSIDPGRYLVAQAGFFVASVVDSKQRNGRRWLLTDGGIHNLYRPRFPHANQMVFALTSGPPLQEPASWAGPLLTPDDVLADGLRLPALARGDLLAMAWTGAYGYGHGIQSFCMQSNACEVGAGRFGQRLLRARYTADDRLSRQLSVRSPTSVCTSPLGAECGSSGQVPDERGHGEQVPGERGHGEQVNGEQVLRLRATSTTAK